MEARMDKVEARIDKVEAQMVELSRIIDKGFQAIPEQLRVELSGFRDEVMEVLGLRRSAPMVVAQTPGLSSIHGKDVQIPSEELDKIARDSDVEQEKKLRIMLELLVHAPQCQSPECQYPNCRKVKGVLRHGIQCKRRASGGCLLCKKMWYLLQLHARACQESECHVPRCRDLKEHLRRLQQQAELRRLMEMMRQNAAGNSA